MLFLSVLCVITSTLCCVPLSLLYFLISSSSFKPRKKSRFESHQNTLNCVSLLVPALFAKCIQKPIKIFCVVLKKSADSNDVVLRNGNSLVKSNQKPREEVSEVSKFYLKSRLESSPTKTQNFIKKRISKKYFLFRGSKVRQRETSFHSISFHCFLTCSSSLNECRYIFCEQSFEKCFVSFLNSRWVVRSR
jgi:hypothetical protein